MNLFSWLQPTFQQITQTLNNNKAHHALLIKSLDGLGVENLLNKISELLICGQHPDDKTINLFKSNNHPDWIKLRSIDNKDITIDEIRAVINKVQKFSHQDGNIVIQIENINKLNINAANALLKILEEPPQKCYFVMQAPINAQVLATIQSRCQIWHIDPPILLMQNWLLEQLNDVSKEDVAIALNVCNFKVLQALDFIKQDKIVMRQEFMRSFWRFFQTKNLIPFIKSFPTTKDQRSLTIEKLQWLITFWGDSLKLKLNITENLTNPDLKNGCERFIQKMTHLQLVQGLEILQKGCNKLQKNNSLDLELIVTAMFAEIVLEVLQ